MNKEREGDGYKLKRRCVCMSVCVCVYVCVYVFGKKVDRVLGGEERKATSFGKDR